MNRLLALISLIPFAIGCSPERSAEVSLRQYSDPVTGERQVLQAHEIGPWSVYTYPGDENALIMVTKHGKPIVSIGDSGSRVVMVHSANSSLSAATLVDEEIDGEFNRIEYGNGSFFAQDLNFDGWIDTLSVDGRTLIWLDNQWLELVSHQTEDRRARHFVEIASVRHRVVFREGSWRIADKAEE